jgi:hypothetical protein
MITTAAAVLVLLATTGLPAFPPDASAAEPMYFDAAYHDATHGDTAPADTPAVSLQADAQEEDTAGGPERAPLRVYTGMWTFHFRDPGAGVEPNHLLAVSWRGWYVAGFTNSFRQRAFSAGIERAPYSREVGPVTASAGYRAGLVSGYDERFHRIAAYTPVIPFLQLRASAEYRRAAVEWSWAGIVTSVSLNFRM